MEFDIKILKKKLNKLEFDKTKSELLIAFIDKSGEAGIELKMHLNEVMKCSFDIRNDIKDQFKLYEINNDYNLHLKSMEVVAIDGSSNIGGQLSGKFVCLYSVARIHLIIDDLNNIIPSEYYWGDLEIIDSLDDIKIKQELETRMLQRETEAYEDSIDLFNPISDKPKIIFVDGPIIDPPTYKDIKYIKFRCTAIKKVINKNIFLMGCVKRIYGNKFCNYVKELITDVDLQNKISLYLNDNFLISSIFADYRKQRKYHGSLITNFYESKYISDETGGKYLTNGIRIKSLFFQYSTKHKLIRIDIPFLKDFDGNLSEIYELIKKNLVEWSYPGIDVPYPVYLAHEFSKVRNGCAQKIYDDIISRNLSNKPIGQLLVNMLM